MFLVSLDGIAIRALTEELNTLLAGGRIDKIQQPDSQTIIFNIRQRGQNHKLLISIHPQSARFHITNTNKPNPQQPPLFCMVLRKYLEGSKLQSIKQQGLERIVHFDFIGYDELGEKSNKVLICEFMGKHSNMILINPKTNLIIDSIKRLGSSTSQYRQVLPGLTYISPPPQKKISPQELTEEKLIQFFLENNSEKSISQGLLELVTGIGPQTSKELVIRAGINPDTGIEFLGQYEYSKLWQQITWLNNLIINNDYQPTLVKNKENPIAFAPFFLEQFTGLNQISFPTMSELVEFFIGKKEESNLFKQKSLALEKVIDRELERCQKKLVLQLNKIAEGKQGEKYKIWGELLTANLYQLKQSNKAIVPNFYSENQELIEIPMDENLTPNENAQNYFKKYNKTKIGVEKAKEQSKLTQEEISYLETIKSSLERAESLSELQEIRWELEEAGYIKSKPEKNKSRDKNSTPTPSPHSFYINGFKVLVGKNNKQNDYLTLKIAKNNDLWLHVKDIPGSHVVIKNPENKDIPEKVLKTAAMLAAYFSKGRFSSQVPVDYTLKKNVRKPKGAKPGMVIYDNQKTLFVTCEEKYIEEIIQGSDL